MLTAFRRPTALALLALACAIGAGCGGAKGGGLDGNVYRDEKVAFHVGPVPAEWRAVRVDAASLAFRDETHRASVLVNARCGRKDQDTPLVALTAHLLMGTTEREATVEETIPFDGREALHSRLTAKLDGVPMAYDVYVLKKDGCVYDFVHVGDPRTLAGGTEGYARFVQGFHTVSDGSP